MFSVVRFFFKVNKAVYKICSGNGVGMDVIFTGEWGGNGGRLAGDGMGMKVSSVGMKKKLINSGWEWGKT